MKRWTIKQLDETDSLTFAMCILSERREMLNQNAPFAIKLAEAYNELSELKDARRKHPEYPLMEAIYRKVQYDHLLSDIEARMENESYESLDCLEKHGLTAKEVLANTPLLTRILELLQVHENEYDFWRALDRAVIEAVGEMAAAA